MSSFTSLLIVSPLPDGERWKLVRSFSYHIGGKYSKEFIQVPAGFITDFASTPPHIWMIIPPWGKYGKAAVIHDYLYQTGLHTREEADYIFKEAMGVLGVSKLKIFLMYWAVRIFGGSAYKESGSV